MLAVLGRNELTREMATLPAADTRLAIDLEGRDPDDGMTPVAYEKGAALLFTIEQMVGRDRFDPWLRGYFNRHAFTSISAPQFVADLQQELLRGDQALFERIDIPAWLNQPGLPATAAQPSRRSRAKRRASPTAPTRRACRYRDGRRSSGSTCSKHCAPAGSHPRRCATSTRRIG